MSATSALLQGLLWACQPLKHQWCIRGGRQHPDVDLYRHCQWPPSHAVAELDYQGTCMMQWSIHAHSCIPDIVAWSLTIALLSLCMQATSVGQAVAGFAVSVLSFITTWAALVPDPGQERSPADVAVTAFAYFTLSAAVIVASVAGYFLLQYLPFWLHHTSSHSGHGVLIMFHLV